MGKSSASENPGKSLCAVGSIRMTTANKQINLEIQYFYIEEKT